MCPRLDSGDPHDALAALSRTIRQHYGLTAEPLAEVLPTELKSQGLQANQQVTFLSDGADDVRELPLYLSPESEHWLDWFHVAMRLRVMGQMAA